MRKLTMYVTFRSSIGDEHEALAQLVVKASEVPRLKDEMSKAFFDLMASEQLIKIKTTGGTQVFIRTEEITEIVVDYYEMKHVEDDAQ